MQKQTQLTQFFTKKLVQNESSPVRTKIQVEVQDSQYKQQFFCTPPTSEIQNKSLKRKNQTNLDHWIKKLTSCQKRWPFLPKNIIYHIYKYLQLRECATCSQVCKYWMICYNDIYFSYSFFREFATSRYNEKELATVLKRSSKELKHIKKVKDMIKGQKISSFLEKTDLRTMLSENSQQEGSLLEFFKLEPKRQFSSVFLTDKDLKSICCESYNSLQYIQLISCQFMTGKGFESIAVCTHLTFINIQNNTNLKDENIEKIVERTSQLKILILLKCESLTTQVFSIIARNCKKLERLDIGSNTQLDITNIDQLKDIPNLMSLQLKENIVTNEAIEKIVTNLRNLNSLNLEGCTEVNGHTLLQLQQLQLQRLNLKRIPLKEEEIYNFLLNAKTVKLLLLNNNLQSTRIEKILLSRQ